jgi:hypothetical protein
MRSSMVAMALGSLISACGGSPASGSADPGAGGNTSTGGNGGTASGGSTAGGSSAAGGSTTAGGSTSGGSSAGGTGGSGASGGSPNGGSSGNGGNGTTLTCSGEIAPLPEGAPALEPGVWKNISPSPWPDGICATGLAVNPCNPGVIYVGYNTIARSTDAGSTWTNVGLVEGTSDPMDGSNHIRIDPTNPLHMYATTGVGGAHLGFFVSHDGGDTFAMPESFQNIQAEQNLFATDLYDVAVDPTDFNHLLVTSHSAWGWTDTKWNTNAGVLESTDGGDTWIVHDPEPGWGYGHSISFLYNPELGIGDANTWLLGIQDGGGYWRTTNAGEDWAHVLTDGGIQHGGGNAYYTSDGSLYYSGNPRNRRSTDNGATWTEIGPSGAFTAIYGDGDTLYTGQNFGPAPFDVSPEDDGDNWEPYNEQEFEQGPFAMTLDPTNRILYSASCQAGLLALKLP